MFLILYTLELYFADKINTSMYWFHRWCCFSHQYNYMDQTNTCKMMNVDITKITNKYLINRAKKKYFKDAQKKDKSTVITLCDTLWKIDKNKDATKSYIKGDIKKSTVFKFLKQLPWVLNATKKETYFA